MKPADLQALLDAHDAEGCLAMFKTATEAERRALAKTAATRLRAVSLFQPFYLLAQASRQTEEQLAAQFPLAAKERGGLRAAQIAVLATATLTELRRFGVDCYPTADDAVAVLSARRPPWVGEWADLILSWSGPRLWLYNVGGRWRLVRRLVHEGLCERPRSSSYIHGMIVEIIPPRASITLREALLADPALLKEEIWEVFETEPTRGQLEGLPFRPGGSSEARWETTLAALAAEGRISRTRLIDASLGGLERDFHELRARWFALMHDTLEPTLDERADRAGRYLGLASSRNPSTVKFALEALALLDTQERLEPGLLVDAIGPALLARHKATVRAALTLIDRAARRDPAVRARAAAVAVEALAHDSPAIQESALNLIERHGEPADRALAELLQSRMGTVAASQRGRLTAWLGVSPASEPPEAIDDGQGDLIARASALDPLIAERTGVSAALAVLEHGGGEVPAVDFDETEAPRLDPEGLVRPVAGLDELIRRFSSVLENPEDPEELERVLDGVSRLCDQIPDDFAARTGALRARAGCVDILTANLSRPLCGLALAWITGKPHAVRYADLHGNLVGFFARRVLAIAGRAALRQAAPLLSAPTHKGGWIDPRVLVERVQLWASLPDHLDRIDGALAILRLAPDAGPRALALEASADLEGHYAAALRYALGSDRESIGPDARIWVAATRARAPRDDDPLVEARHPGLGPDAGQAARCTLRPGPHQIVRTYSWGCKLIVREPPLPLTHAYELPTALLHDERARGWLGRWLATLWPIGRDSFFAAGVESILGNETTPSEVSSVRPYLEPLLDPDVPLREMARLLLAGSLSASAPELQGLATDALIAAIGDGRIDGNRLSQAVGRVLTEGLAKPSRLAKALGDAARVSPLHSLTVAHALELMMSGLTPPPRDLHLFLELLKELLVETGERLTVPEAVDSLRGLKVSGKTAKLARELLGLEERPAATARRSAAVRALAGRVERALRWTRRRHSPRS